MSSLMKRAQDKLHGREIKTDIYQVDDNYILAEGQLIDQRTKAYQLLSGEEKLPGYLHFLKVRLLIEIPKMVIQDLEVELEVVPREECRQIQEAFQVLKGLTITSGFTSKVRGLLGGIKGCTHLLHLIIVMAPAIMQGYWSYNASKPLENRKKELRQVAKDRIPLLYKILKNTCYVWREDGFAFRNLKETIRKVRETNK